ncbi:MAG: addiction module protein [Verrucomicrobia bacterium]|nr:addiction module protein [Verrucomicrobiota bacterium]
MTTLFQEIEQKAGQLSPEEREMLAERLLARADDIRLTDIDDAWIAEAERRYAAWKAGSTVAIPADQALKDIRDEIKR